MKVRDIQRRWRRLSEEDVAAVGTDRRRLVELIRGTYGLSERAAVAQVVEFLRRGDDDTDYTAVAHVVGVVGHEALGSRLKKLGFEDLSRIGQNPRTAVDLVTRRYGLPPGQAARRLHDTAVRIQIGRIARGSDLKGVLGDDDTPYSDIPLWMTNLWMTKK
ncbi:MAG: hypothetical protein SF066_16785 [Thermoanaerobaculia bacterium]|nr:hypothetical protein [Thermoanaerobaculia bacterium]